MYRFIVTIHARPAEAAEAGEIEVAGRRVRTMQVPQATLAATRMGCTFEAACEQLSALERMFCEPDGSFVWTSARGQPAWQIDGNLYDHQGRLQFVDLSGTCPAEHFDRLLAAFGWPETPLVFQLTREGVLLDEAEFRRFAAGE